MNELQFEDWSSRQENLDSTGQLNLLELSKPTDVSNGSKNDIINPSEPSEPPGLQSDISVTTDKGFDEPNRDTRLDDTSRRNLASAAAESLIEGHELGKDAFNEIKKGDKELISKINEQLKAQGSTLRIELQSDSRHGGGGGIFVNSKESIVLRDTKEKAQSPDQKTDLPRSWQLHDSTFWSISAPGGPVSSGSTNIEFDYFGKKKVTTSK